MREDTLTHANSMEMEWNIVAWKEQALWRKNHQPKKSTNKWNIKNAAFIASTSIKVRTMLSLGCWWLHVNNRAMVFNV